MLLLLGLAACAGKDWPEVPEPGVSRQLAEYRKAHLADLRYELDISVPEASTGRLTGTNAITFTLASLKRPVVLDFKVSRDHLKAVIVAGDTVPYRFENGHIIIDSQFFRKGDNRIDLRFDLGDQSLNRQEEFLYTLLVPDRAATAFPCFDQPNLKARYRLRLTIPREWEALTNGALENEEILDSVRRLTYAETRPLPTYLFDFVVGRFQTISSELGGRRMTMLHRETDTARVQRNAPVIFDLHLTALNWLENYTGMEMPFQKFDFALIPAFQYGGMEHPGAITYKASSLFLDENATQSQELGRASLIAHETAHMWFGNLVTMNWFDDVWMKEVFANFMAAKIVHPSFPDIDHDLRFLLAHYPGAYSVDRTGGAHPIQQQLDNLKDAGTLYGAIIYQKAPIVMRMLERTIGEEAMQKGLQEYLQTYAYDNATWDDLIEILDRQTDDNLEAWNRQWIKQAGMPEIGLSRVAADEVGGDRIELVLQNREPNRGWSQPLELAVFGKDGVERLPVDFDGSWQGVGGERRPENMQLILPNGGGYGYGYFALAPADLQYLLTHVNELEEPMWRATGWLNLWENMLHRRLAPGDLLPTLLQGVASESDPLLLQRMLSYLGSLYWKFLPAAERQAATARVEQVLWETFGATQDSRLKRALFRTYRSVVESEEGLARLQGIFAETMALEGLRLSENDYTDLALELAVREVPNGMALLDRQLERISNSDRQARLRFIRPALSPEAAVRDSFFNSLRREENRRVEPWVQEALGWLHHPLRAESAEKYILPTLDMLEELQATGDIFFPKRVLDQTFSGHRSKTAARIVERFLADRSDYPANLRGKILQAADGTLRAAKIDG